MNIRAAFSNGQTNSSHVSEKLEEDFTTSAIFENATGIRTLKTASGEAGLRFVGGEALSVGSLSNEAEVRPTMSLEVFYAADV